MPVDSAAKEKRAGAVAKESPEFACHTVRCERAAMNVGGYDGDGLRLPGCEERPRDSKGIEQAETGAANIERAAIFADEQPGMKLRRERRIIVVRFNGCDDPIEFLRSAGSSARRARRAVSEDSDKISSLGIPGTSEGLTDGRISAANSLTNLSSAAQSV